MPNITPQPNPHPRGSREWIEHEDAYFRQWRESGEFEQFLHTIAAVARDEAKRGA